MWEKRNNKLKKNWEKLTWGRLVEEVICGIKVALANEPIAIITRWAKEFEKFVRMEADGDHLSGIESENKDL